MFKYILFFVQIVSLNFSYSQKSSFVKNTALRIDYQVFVSHNFDSLKINSVYKIDDFVFNPNSLVDDINYGVHKIEMYVSSSHKLIFSRGF